MSDSLDLLRSRARPAAPAPAPSAAVDSGSDEEECAAFGYLRGIRDRSLSLEMRLADGNSVAFPYSWLGPVRYNPSAGLLLRFVGDLVYLVLIEGSNLNAPARGVSLYDRGLLRHRITWVREMNRQQLAKAGQGEVTVERVRIVAHRPDAEPEGAPWLEAFKDSGP